MFGSKDHLNNVFKKESNYRYSIEQIFAVIAEKITKPLYFRSLIDFKHILINKREIDHILRQIIIRRKRVSY